MSDWTDNDAGAVTGELAFKWLVIFVMSGLLYLTYWTAANGLFLEFFALAFFDVFAFGSWTRAYARTMIRSYDLRPEPTDDDPGEI